MEQLDLFREPIYDGAPQDPPYGYRDRYALLRPRPPEGFRPFKSPSLAGKPCPFCGKPYGSIWGRQEGVNFLDPQAQALYETVKGDWHAYDEAFYEGVRLKSHWSRFYTAVTICCQAELWGDWVSAYSPTKGGYQRYIPSAHYTRPTRQ